MTRRAARLRERREQAKQRGLCRGCFQPHGHGPLAVKPDGKPVYYCDECLRQQAAHRNAALMALQCRACGKPVWIPDNRSQFRVGSHCQECRLRRRVWRRDYRLKHPDPLAPEFRVREAFWKQCSSSGRSAF